ETGPDRFRRGLYTFRYRSVPYPVLQNFDAPIGEQACVRRTKSNTPLQALTTLNEPLFVECAQALAQKTVQEGGPTDADRLTYVSRRCLSRKPSPAESGELLDLLKKETSRFERQSSDAATVAAIKPNAPNATPPVESAAKLAAWTVVSRVLL